MFLNNLIASIPGVGPKKAELLTKQLGLKTYADLLQHYPFRYVDRTQIQKIRDIASDQVAVQLKGKIEQVREVGEGRKKRLTAFLIDDTGRLELVWFKATRYVRTQLVANREYIVFGKPSRFGGKWNIAHPELETEESTRLKLGAGLSPVYRSTELLNAKYLHSKGIEKLVKTLLVQMNGRVEETLPDSMVQRFGFLGREEAIRQVHAPASPDLLQHARRRLKFEELFFLQLILLRNKVIQMQSYKGFELPQVGEIFMEFYENHLPFELTGAQKRVLKEVRAGMKTGAQMNRLIQGDVGSGKTIVALLAGLIAIGNGYQVCLMAPTEILARQHHEGISALLNEMDLRVEILTGSTKKSARKPIHEGLLDGSIDLLIGTHSLIEPTVQFKNLGMAIIDEQHRFGVKQRAQLWKKNSLPPHVLVMTATPIPRTLAMTLYGDLDVSVIDELPPGRKPVKTVHRLESARGPVFKFMEDQIAEGRQIYIVYPLIEESETLDLNHLMDGFESISRRFPLPDYRVSIVHGKMDNEAKAYEMARFVKGETQLMVATTVIEVGVNVPNASVMVIENTERFGLSQLHQLRGRVGRGADQSFCILMSSDKISREATKRIKTMCSTNDGFEIAEVDLELRGPGDLMGTQQSGVLDLSIADLVMDKELLEQARALATEILESDPNLEQPGNRIIREELRQLQIKKPNWGMIS